MRTSGIVVAMLFSVLAPAVQAADWTSFRGPRGDGVSPETDLPVELKSENTVWKIKLPGPGASSPIVLGEKVFVTAYSGYGTSINKGKGGFGGGFGKGGGGFGKGGFGKGAVDPEQKKLRLHVIAIDRASGKTIWDTEVAPRLPETAGSGMLLEHGYASATPVTDGERVYAFFGKTGVFAFDMSGKQLWQADVGSNLHGLGWGSAASPIVHKDLVIVNASIESDSLVALDKRTGKEKWRVKGMGTTWSSPLLVETKSGHEVVMSLPGKIVGYDADTGKERWHCKGIGGGSGGGFGGGKGGGKGGGFGGGSYTASTPVARGDVVYCIGGGGPTTPAAAIAVRAGGKGDVDKSHVLWRASAGTTNASPVVVGDHLYFVASSITCLKLADGKQAYKERLYSSSQEYVSPVAAGDRIYALTRTEGLFVLAAGGKFEKLAHNEFDDTSVFNASPAIADGRIYLRSNAYLYAFGKK